jgi:hypothetical protein
MTTPAEEPGDELARAYRGASEGEAGRPDASTRAAILAEARAAALRRTTAANDSRYFRRAAAGIAILGVAVLLWRQADRNLTPDLAVATGNRPVAEHAEPETAARAAAPPANQGIAAPAEAAAEADNEPAAPLASADQAVAEAPARMESAVASAATSEARQRADAPMKAAGALSSSATDYQGLFQREFPEIWNESATARMAWLVTDADGTVVRKGMVAGDALPQGNWTYIAVKTASGRDLQLAVMLTNQDLRPQPD